jgi:hypothetical protein
MIAALRGRGATWAQIAPAIGCADARSAKAKSKRLARQAQAALLRDRTPLDEEVPGD